MALDKIKHLGWLSRIDLADDEIAKYVSQIEGIIHYLDILDNIQLSDVNVMRPAKDVSELRSDTDEKFDGDPLSSTKNRKDGFVKGPRMI